MNSSTLELDSAAQLITQESYYPYGGTCWWAGRNKVEASYKTIRYSGQERDATGLYYYGFRYYAPWCQRWLSADPSGTADGLNLYAMVHSNPVGHVDIAGLAGAPPQPSQTGQLSNASSSAFMRDFASRGIGGIVQMSTVAALNTLTPSRATNTWLEATAGALDGIAVGIVAGGLAARFHRNATPVGLIVGLLIGVAPTAWSHEDGPDESEVELNQTAINRIGAAAGAITREISQQTFRGFGANFPWGSVNVQRRLPTINRTALAYSVFTGLNGAFSQFLPDSLRSWVSPLVEGADGFVGTWLRGRHPDTTFSQGSAPLQVPPIADTVFGATGRIAGGVFSYGATVLVEAVTAHATGLPPAERAMAAQILSGGITGMLTGATEYRGALMAVTQDGYRQFNPQIVDSISPDVQTATPKFTGRAIQRRHSYSV